MSKIDELFGERIKENALDSDYIDKVETENEVEIKKIDKFLTVVLLLLILIIPLVVRVHFSDFVSPQVTGTDLDSGSKSDIFTFYKFVLLLIGTMILGLVFLYKVIFVGYVIPKSKINILTGILAVTILLSAIFAPNKTLALIGMYNRHEGTLTYLCYIALFFIASNIKYTAKQLSLFIYILYPFVIINTTLGLLNFFGIDILKYEFGRAILFSGLPEGSNLQEGSKFLATINHGNYVSGFAAVLIGLFLTMSLLDNNKVRSLINLFFALASFAMLLGSLSSSGFVTLLVILPIMALLVIKAKGKRYFATIFVLFFIVGSGIFTIMAKYNPQVWNESIGVILKNNPFENVQSAIGKVLESDKVYANEKVDYNFPNLPESGVGPGSGRLYIWGKTWELIKERPLFGYGLDTMPFHFPQNDTGKHENIETYRVIVDKPHNIYVGVAYGSGLLAFVFLLSFITMQLIAVAKKLVLKASLVGYSLFIGIIAFLVQFLFNDSLLGTTFIFWVLFGLFNDISKLNQT
ncbi:O-antigen ligase family protein [Bacillus sp. FJAT-29937]|uniref:O-antigen ligase family protein n=1 Tax=Bacillus sp. FJAT-29937 TaxID=1720553 RepID=UPI0009E7ABF0|nr:O-antigen ligase family protein [Bacillus sp. FJAT-29937]